MTTNPASSATIHHYLLNVVAELRDGVLPHVADESSNRASECLEVLARITVALRPSDAADDEGVVAESVRLEDGESQLRQMMKPTPRSGATIDQDALEHWMRSTLPDAANLRLTEIKELQGGRSKKTLLLAQSGCSTLPERLVARCDLNSALTGTSITSEFDLLRRLHDSGLRVPKVLCLNDQSEPLGAPFLLLERLQGRPLGDFFNAPADRSVVLQFAEQLGHLHSLPVDAFADCKALRTSAVTAEALKSELERLQAEVEKLGDGSAIEADTCRWLSAHLDTTDPLLSLVHGDAGFHNMLVHEGRLTAVLDWELAHVGHPAEDLGYCRSAIEGRVDWSEFLAAYRAGGAPSLTEAAINFYTLWVLFRFHALAVRVRAGVAAGAVPGLDLTLTSVLFPPNLQRLMARYLQQFGG